MNFFLFGAIEKVFYFGRVNISCCIFVVFLLLSSASNVCNGGETSYELTAININGDEGWGNSTFLCYAKGAAFGDSIDDDGISGCVAPADPLNACTPIESGLNVSVNSPLKICDMMIALIKRENCSFSVKVMNAQNADFSAAIVFDNVAHESTITMNGDGDSITIPSFFISNDCGMRLLTNFTSSQGFSLFIRPVTFSDWWRYLIPFIAVVGLCFLVTLIALIVKLAHDRRKELRRRLSRKKLKKLPTRKYKKNETPETCPICLEDFVEGEKLRVLPCKHWYHLKCVDPWLTKNRKVCPVCKRKVLADDSDSSDSETTSNNEEARSSERRPLLSPISPETYGSLASFPAAVQAEENESPSSSTSSSLTNEQSAIVVGGFTGVKRAESPTKTTTANGVVNEAYENVEVLDASTSSTQPTPTEEVVVVGGGYENANISPETTRRSENIV